MYSNTIYIFYIYLSQEAINESISMSVKESERFCLKYGIIQEVWMRIVYDSCLCVKLLRSTLITKPCVLTLK